MKPTIKDVAKLAKVSISTVSRVMNAPDSVVQSKKARVLQAIEELKYQPNALARGLIYKKTDTLGVVIPDIRNAYYADIIRGMEDASKKLGYSLFICNTDSDKDRLFSYLNTFYERQVDGILYTSNPILPDYYNELIRLKMPVVLVSTHSMEYELPSVKIDDEQAAYDATEYLIGLGHRDIGMISFDLRDSIAGVTRFQGFVRAIREHGLAHNAENLYFVSEHDFDPSLAAEQLLLKAPHVTAIFTASDIMAIGLMSYLHERNVKVPEDISVIGFDNIRISRTSIPKLTTVAQPMYEIGHRAVEKLHTRIVGQEDRLLREIMPHEIVMRDSTIKRNP